MTAWDLSPVAIERLRSDAEAAGLQVTAEARDVISQPPVAASFDFILVSHFLERSLVSAIIAALNLEGCSSTRPSVKVPSVTAGRQILIFVSPTMNY